MEYLFSEFEAIKTTDWWAKVEKDLKNKSIDTLNWDVEEGISIAPFYREEDVRVNSLAIGKDNDWKIGELLNNDKPKASNQTLLEGLQGGVQSPMLILQKLPTKAEWDIISNEVVWHYISLHLVQNKDALTTLKRLQNWTKCNNINSSKLNGYLYQKLYNDNSQVVDQIEWAEKNLPNFKILALDARILYNEDKPTTYELSEILKYAENILSDLINKGVSLDVLQKHFSFNFSIGNSFFVAIAKVRAFKQLWMNVLHAYGVSNPIPPHIHITTTIDNKDKNSHANLIQSTTQCLAASIAGAETIFVSPFVPKIDSKENKSSDKRRLARNVQHILKNESYLNQVLDPGSGSYYIEKLTEAFAVKAWEKFRAN